MTPQPEIVPIWWTSVTFWETRQPPNRCDMAERDIGDSADALYPQKCHASTTLCRGDKRDKCHACHGVTFVHQVGTIVASEHNHEGKRSNDR
jgi:hypothetical protein